MGDKMISGVKRDRPKGKNRVCVFPCHHLRLSVCFAKQNKEVMMGKIQFQGLLPLMMFCALIIAGLCFGQYVKSDIAPCHAEPFLTQCHPELVSGSHIRQYVKPLSRWDRLTMFNLQAQTPQFFNTMLMMQVEGESLKPKTSFWKQAGIYGLEFVGGGVVGTAISYYTAYIAEGGGDFDHPTYFIFGYAVGHILFTSSCTWITGKLLGQKGSWRKSALGTASGCLIGIPVALLLNKMYPEGFMNGVALGIFLVTPPSGAVIGFNIK